MKRLTTDDSKSILCGLNLFFAKDGEVWIRGGGPEPDYQDCTLVDYIVRAAETHHLNIVSRDVENLGDEMYDCLQYGTEELEGVVALLHAAAVQAAEMRGRLEMIEEILSNDYDLDRLRELVEADREGRIKILPKPEANTCGSCGHFRRIAGKSLGTCGEQAYYKTRRGEIEPGRGTFMPSQSRKACKKYIQSAENEK